MTVKTTGKKQFVALIILLAVGILVICGVILWWLRPVSAETYPLGNKLDYLGEVSYGCTLICDSDRASTYYYGTDMNIEEVAAYFNKATLDNKKDLALQESPSVPRSLSFKTVRGDVFDITYYLEGKEYNAKFGLKPTKTRHTLVILDEQYPLARESL